MSEQYRKFPNGSLFKFTGLGSNNILYQKIDILTYCRAYISSTQVLRVIVEGEI